jgi:hypothetical protein
VTFAEAFQDELAKLGAVGKPRRKKMSPLIKAIRGAFVGAGLGAAAAGMGAPFTYTSYRRGPKMLSRRDALVSTLLRLGERSAYGIPIGMVSALGT